jgi:hypothetical protein
MTLISFSHPRKKANFTTPWPSGKEQNDCEGIRNAAG